MIVEIYVRALRQILEVKAITWAYRWIEPMYGVALTEKSDGTFHSRLIWFCHWYNFWIVIWLSVGCWLTRTRTRTKSWHKQLQKQLPLPHELNQVGIWPAPRYVRNNVSVGAVTSPSQSTVGFFPLKGNGYPTHVCIVLCHQLCFLAAVPARGVWDCSILIPQHFPLISIYANTIFEDIFYD